jgi:spermidine synthase
MIPWTLLDSAQVPGHGDEIRLYRRGEEYSIRVGSYELMNNRVHGSEDALASIVCGRLRDRAAARVLVGGLGMGFTLAGVLKECGARCQVVVAELIPAVVAWNRADLGAFAGNPLADPRVTVREADVGELIRGERGAFDAILLDVDNGPAGLTTPMNDRLYGPAGLRAAHTALRAGGFLAVWSAGPDAAFTRRLHAAGFEAEQMNVRARGAAGGSRFLIWLAQRK